MEQREGDGKAMARRKVAYRKRSQNRFSMFLVSLVVLMIMVAVSGRRRGMQKKIDEKKAELKQLETEIAEEEKRALEIEEFGKEVKTKGYIENLAREKLGLVYEGEILFKEDK